MEFASENSLQQRIIEKAAINDNFRNELLANPKEAIERVFKIICPKDLSIKVFANTKDCINIVLPAKEEDKKPVAGW